MMSPLDVSVRWFGEQTKLERLKNLRENVDWEIEDERYEFHDQFIHLISNWTSQFPDLLDIFRPEEIEYLLSEALTYHGTDANRLGELIIEFVALTGYEDEDYEVDKNGKPLLCRKTPVHQASEDLSRGVCDNYVHELFKIYNRFDLNYIDSESGLTHFHVACMAGCYGVVKKFLKLGQNPNCLVQQTGDSPLHLALKHRRFYVVQLLLRRGADPKLANADEFTPLHIMGMYGAYGDVAKMFFEIIDNKHQPLQIDARDKLGRTPLHLALKHRNWCLAEFLIIKGADLSLSNAKGSTPLHLIVKHNQRHLLELFCMIKDDKHQLVSVDVKDNLSRTPLHLAVTRGYKEIAEYLLKRGADPNLANAQGFTPLHMLCKDNKEIAELLLRRGTDPNLANAQGFTPLHMFCKDNKEIAESLLRRGADPNLANAQGFTLLHMLCKDNNHELADVFFKINKEINQSVKVDAKDNLGRTPLQLAVASLAMETMDVVLDHGADLSSFVFPTVNDFDECFAVDENEKHRLKVKYASGPLAIVECLEKRGFLMDRSDAVTIMKLIIKHELYEKSSNLKNVLGKDKFFTNQVRKIRIVDSGTSPSLYDLIRLRPEKVAAKQLTCLDYFKFAGSKKFSKIPEGHREACALHLCEIISRRFFRRWTLDPLLELMRYRLPILCCDIIIDKLTYRDLCNICLAATIQQSS